MNSTHITNIDTSPNTDNDEKPKDPSNESLEEIRSMPLLRHLSAVTPDSPEFNSNPNKSETSQNPTPIISLNAISEMVADGQSNDFVFCANLAKVCDGKEKEGVEQTEATFDDVVNEINSSSKNGYNEDEEFTENSLIVIQELLYKTIETVAVDNDVNGVNQPMSAGAQNEEFQDANDKTPMQNDTLIQVKSFNLCL